MIESGPFEAAINTHGAWVETLTGPNQSNLLHPKGRIEVNGASKLRGGMHVCLPNFGPNATKERLVQHGFGRNVDWDVTAEDDSVLELEHETSQGSYRGLLSTLRYELTDISQNQSESRVVFTAILRLANNRPSFGSRPPKSLTVAPGFHPYFATNGQRARYKQGNFTAEATILPAKPPQQRSNPEYIKLGSTTLSIAESNLPVAVLWSDQPDRYVCYEPTAAGASFAAPEKPEANLPSGQSIDYIASFTWQIPKH